MSSLKKVFPSLSSLFRLMLALSSLSPSHLASARQVSLSCYPSLGVSLYLEQVLLFFFLLPLFSAPSFIRAISHLPPTNPFPCFKGSFIYELLPFPHFPYSKSLLHLRTQYMHPACVLGQRMTFFSRLGDKAPPLLCVSMSSLRRLQLSSFHISTFFVFFLCLALYMLTSTRICCCDARQ